MRLGIDRKLEMLNSLSDIDPMIDAMVSPDRIPGFQISPDVSEFIIVRNSIVESVRRHIPHFDPTDTFRKGLSACLTTDLNWHNDGGYEGVAIHYSIKGSGKVWLQNCTLGSDKDGAVAPAQHAERWLRKYTSGPRYKGTLSNGMITVFSESIYMPGLVIPPAFHNFKSDKLGRQWERHAHPIRN